MSWVREGQQVSGLYLGNVVSGTVTNSRVKYGGAVQHTVALDKPLAVMGRIADHVLLDEADLLTKENEHKA